VTEDYASAPEVPAAAPWLAAVPTFPDRLADAARLDDDGEQALRPLDELALDWQIRRFKRLIRGAREQFERCHGILILP